MKRTLAAVIVQGIFREFGITERWLVLHTSQISGGPAPEFTSREDADAYLALPGVRTGRPLVYRRWASDWKLEEGR